MRFERLSPSSPEPIDRSAVCDSHYVWPVFLLLPLLFLSSIDRCWSVSSGLDTGLVRVLVHLRNSVVALVVNAS